jgi:hypothetical protein
MSLSVIISLSMKARPPASVRGSLLSSIKEKTPAAPTSTSDSALLLSKNEPAKKPLKSGFPESSISPLLKLNLKLPSLLTVIA